MCEQRGGGQFEQWGVWHNAMAQRIVSTVRPLARSLLALSLTLQFSPAEHVEWTVTVPSCRKMSGPSGAVLPENETP